MIEVEQRVKEVLGVTANPHGPGSPRWAATSPPTSKVPGTASASPRVNAFAERFVCTVREDCFGHLLVVSRRHLEVVLADYVRHYHAARPHRGLGLEQPIPRPTPSVPRGRILRHDVLGGLIHEYERAA